MMPPPAKMRETCKKVPRIFRLALSGFVMATPHNSRLTA
jgi:hypothetical protein